MVGALDAWAKRNNCASRSDAIRQLIESGLAGSQPMGQRSPKAVSKASELAGQQIDKLADPSATDEERHTRKRRLLKGPVEFRDIRGDIPKLKR
jgi:hypothetical protein